MLSLVAFLGSPLGKLAGYAMLAMVLFATLAGVKHEWSLGQAARRQVREIVHTSALSEKRIQTSDKRAASAEPKAQARIVIRTRYLIRKVPTYVPISDPCIPWGAVRLLDAAVLGIDPSALQPPAGQPDDACSDVTAAALVARVISNYGVAEQNAEQLNALEANLRARAAEASPHG